MNKETRQSGSTIIELATCAVFAVIMALFCFNGCIMIYAAGILDEATRDAGRCAALAPDAISAQNAANAALARHAVNLPFVNGLQLSGPVQYVTTFSPPLDQLPDPNGGPATMAPVPYVQLNTQIAAKMPAPILAFFGNSYGTGDLSFRDTVSFPLLDNGNTISLGEFDAQLPVWTLPNSPCDNYVSIDPKACPPAMQLCSPGPQPVEKPSPPQPFSAAPTPSG